MGSILRSRPGTPYAKLRQLGEEGDAYWLEFPTGFAGGDADARWDVFGYSEDWVLIHTDDPHPLRHKTLWRRWADLPPFEIVES